MQRLSLELATRVLGYAQSYLHGLSVPFIHTVPQGIGITTAKSAIYTLLGGIDPSKTLSVVLDVGTDNENLLNDNLYVVCTCHPELADWC